MVQKKTKKRKTPSRNGQLIRAMSILKILMFKKRPATIQSLSKKFHVHPKTIRRDLVAIEKSGFKLKRAYRLDESRAYISLKSPKSH